MMDTLTDKNIAKKENGSYALTACGVIWEDRTNYSRGERGKKAPTSFDFQLANKMVIFITCGHIHYRDTWIMSCSGLNIREEECKGCNTATEAAEFAVRTVKSRAADMNKALMSLKTSTEDADISGQDLLDQTAEMNGRLSRMSTGISLKSGIEDFGSHNPNYIADKVQNLIHVAEHVKGQLRMKAI